MSALKDFYDYVIPELNGIGTALVDQTLREVARDFCSRSRAWRGEFDPLSTVAAQDTYDLEPSETQAETVQVHRLTVNDVLLFDDGWDQARWRGVRSSSAAIEPLYDRAAPPFTISDDLSQIVLVEPEIPTAAQSAGLLITGSMKPTVGANVLPDFLLTVHIAAIRAGALGRLMLMSNKPWTALAQAVVYRSDYDSMVLHAATNAQTGNTRRTLRTKKWG